MNAEDSKARLQELDERIDAIAKIAAECMERLERVLKLTKSENP